LSVSCGPVTFTVTEQLGPLGTLAKLPVDYREAAFDFACWLAEGESVTSIQQYGITANPQVPDNICADSKAGSWSIAFTCSTGSVVSHTHAATPLTDTTPLLVVGANVAPNGKQATILLGDGTAGITYGVGFLAIVAPTPRRKVINFLVCVDTPLVTISSVPTLPVPPPFQTVTGSTNLPVGTTGSVFVNNTTNTAITITLPPLPTINQNLVIKDIAGNAGTYNITIIASGYTIDGQPSLVLSYNYAWAELTFTGTQWVQV